MFCATIPVGAIPETDLSFHFHFLLGHLNFELQFLVRRIGFLFGLLGSSIRPVVGTLCGGFYAIFTIPGRRVKRRCMG
jgi:hypothetical protein